MKLYQLFFAICAFTIQTLFAQEFKVDPRTQLEKENAMGFYNPENTSTLDLLEALEIQGITIHKIELGKFDKNYSIMLLTDRYDSGKLVKTDTLAQFESTYRYYEADTPYLDFLDKIKIITNTTDNQSELHLRTYNLGAKAKIELKRSNENSFFNWRSYKNTTWELNKKIPLLVFASSWKDEKYGFDRFCGVAFLTENGKGTNELLAFSPSYATIYYQVSEK